MTVADRGRDLREQAPHLRLAQASLRADVRVQVAVVRLEEEERATGRPHHFVEVVDVLVVTHAHVCLESILKIGCFNNLNQKQRQHDNIWLHVLCF